MGNINTVNNMTNMYNNYNPPNNFNMMNPSINNNSAYNAQTEKLILKMNQEER